MELGGEAWSVDQSHRSPIARTVLEVNLLTESDLASYHQVIAQGVRGARAAGVLGQPLEL